MWQLVAEDFGPFNVDITTEDPGTAALKFAGGGDAEYGTRIVISPTDAWLGDGYGGVAYVGSFKSNTPAFVFSDNLGSFKSVGDASSHESGHTLSLHHDGAPSKAYYADTANGGRSWGTATRVRRQWSKGEYTGADRANEDDLAVLAAYLEYRSTITATPLDRDAARRDRRDTRLRRRQRRRRRVHGRRARRRDRRPVTRLDGVEPVRLGHDPQRGRCCRPSDTPTAVVPAGSNSRGPEWAAHVTGVVPAGRYTIEVRPAGLGTPSNGFSTYGSHGAYRLSVAAGAATSPSRSHPPGAGAADAGPAAPSRRHSLGAGRDRPARGCRRPRVPVAGTFDVPADVTAAALNVTAVGPDDGGFLTVYPCSSAVPTTSTVNFAPGRDIANSTIATLDLDGDVCVYSSAATNVIVDLTVVDRMVRPACRRPRCAVPPTPVPASADPAASRREPCSRSQPAMRGLGGRPERDRRRCRRGRIPDGVSVDRGATGGVDGELRGRRSASQQHDRRSGAGRARVCVFIAAVDVIVDVTAAFSTGASSRTCRPHRNAWRTPAPATWSRRAVRSG